MRGPRHKKPQRPEPVPLGPMGPREIVQGFYTSRLPKLYVPITYQRGHVNGWYHPERNLTGYLPPSPMEDR